MAAPKLDFTTEANAQGVFELLVDEKPVSALKDWDTSEDFQPYNAGLNKISAHHNGGRPPLATVRSSDTAHLQQG